MTREKMIEEFERVFKTTEDVIVVYSPGRVNLIGEHTDYNGGHVFPCALNLGMYAAIRKRDDRKLRFYSLNYENDGILESRVSNIQYSKTDWWANYPKGVVSAFVNKGIVINKGFDMLVYSEIPSASGLSSSACLEVLTAFSLIKLFKLKVSKINTALLCQKAENEFCGVNCGIMDQFAIAMGKKDNAIFLDTATLEYKYLPFVLDGYKLIISCTNKKRGLGASEYNVRRAECEHALEEIKASPECENISNWGELDCETFDANAHYITSEVERRRAKHAVYENQRTIKAVAALEAGDLLEFGKLMNESHDSLRYDYEVTGPELDSIVEESRKIDGVIGSRMTGAGFGGCAVSLVREDCVDEFIKQVGRNYYSDIKLKADFYVIDVGGGPREIKPALQKEG